MSAHKGGAAKNIILSPACQEWARENGHEDAVVEARRVIALYQTSWKLRQLERTTKQQIEAAQKKIDDASHTLESERARLYQIALAELEGLTHEEQQSMLSQVGGSA